MTKISGTLHKDLKTSHIVDHDKCNSTIGNNTFLGFHGNTSNKHLSRFNVQVTEAKWLDRYTGHTQKNGAVYIYI
jgi:hypothetical protein